MLLALIWVASTPIRFPCGAEAATAADQFCYRTSVVITKATAGNLTDYPVGVSVGGHSMVTVQTLNEWGWDILPVNSSVSEIDGMIQDIGAGSPSPTTWWFISDVTGSATTQLQLYSGNTSVRRDQQMYFSTACGNLGGPCNDIVTVSDAAALRLQDNFDIIVSVATSTADQAGDWVDKLDGNNGYRFGTGTTSTGVIYAEVGSGSATSSVSVAWNGDAERVRMRFDAGAATDLDIAFYNTATEAWVSQGATDTGYTSLGTSTAALIIGDGFDGGLHEVELRTNVGGAASYGKLAQWSFNAQDLTQTAVGTVGNGWNYTGTVEDVIGPYDGTYTLIRDQSLITVALKPTAYQYSGTATAATETLSDIFGDIGSGDFSVTPTNPNYKALGQFGDVLTQAVDNTDISRQSFMFMLTLVIGLIISGGAWLVTGRNETIFAIVLIIVFGLGAGLGIIPRWWAVLTGFLIFSGWMLSSRVRSSV